MLHRLATREALHTLLHPIPAVAGKAMATAPRRPITSGSPSVSILASAQGDAASTGSVMARELAAWHTARKVLPLLLLLLLLLSLSVGSTDTVA